MAPEDNDTQAFYEAASQPGFPDTMSFQLDRVPGSPGGDMFSAEGVDNLTDQIHDFLLARIFGRHKTGRPAKRLRATVTLSWDDQDEIKQSDHPWFQADEKAGLTPLDGRRREWANRMSPRKESAGLKKPAKASPWEGFGDFLKR